MTDAALPRQEALARHARVRAALRDHGLDGLLAYAPAWRRENVRYLTGARLRGALALAYLPLEGDPIAFVADERDAGAVRAAGAVQDARVVAHGDVAPLAERLRRDGAAQIGVAQAELVPLAIWRALDGSPDAPRLVAATALMDGVRLVKSDWEVERLRRCGDLCDVGWQVLVDALRPGVAEYEVVAEVEAALKAHGAEDNFMLMAAGGDDVRSMAPPSRRRLQVGDLVRTELTPQVDGYWLQICRTAVLGAPSAGQQAAFELFDEALDAGLAAVHPGARAHDVAKAVNDVFRAHGLGEYCSSQHTRVRGHGQGLHLDELPIVEGVQTALEEGAVLIVHPNTYTPLAGYFVLGDPVVVGPDEARPLLRTPRALTRAPA